MAGYWPLAFNEFKFLVQKLMGKKDLGQYPARGRASKRVQGVRTTPAGDEDQNDTFTPLY